jgi:hypothetical protein
MNLAASIKHGELAIQWCQAMEENGNNPAAPECRAIKAAMVALSRRR